MNRSRVARFIQAHAQWQPAYAQVQAARLCFDKPVDGVWLSDHFGVVADLEVGADRPN